MNMIVEDWGIVDYTTAYQRQRKIVDAVIAGGTGRLIFCEHRPVLTMGRLFQANSLLYTKEEISDRGVDLQTVDRGGDITLHAPGQLVIYVIMDLNLYERDLKAYLEKLEQVAVDLLRDFGILAVSVPGKRGVFVGLEKITSIGIGVRKWVSYHGLGVNINTDLSLFSLIKPCGLDVQMTTMKKLLKKAVPMDEVKKKWVENFTSAFKVTIIS
jgi:lipoate-protein ligase B